MLNFIPDKDENEERIEVPYFEEASNADGVIGYSTTKTQKQLKAMITGAFSRLGGSVKGFREGKFKDPTGRTTDRYGFVIDFTYKGVNGSTTVAALPIKKETETRIKKAKRHALYSVNERLVALYNSQLCMPGDIPLLPWLLDSKGRSIADMLRSHGVLSALPEPEEPENNVLDGEFGEV